MPPLLQIKGVKSKLSLELYKDEDSFDRGMWLLFHTDISIYNFPFVPSTCPSPVCNTIDDLVSEVEQ